MALQNEDVLATLRNIQWEQAKAHLAGMLHTYYPEYDGKGNKVPNSFEWLSAEIDKFIEGVEGGF